MRRIATLGLWLGLVSPAGLTVSGQDTASLKPKPLVSYLLGEDSIVKPGAMKGRLEGPFLFHSKIITDTVRKYWVFVPVQYNASRPAAVLVFQDGARATNPDGVLRVQNVLENLIAKQQIPVTIGIFITPGERGTDFPDGIGTGNPNNRDREYDVLDDTYARFIIDEMLPEVGKQYALSSDPAARTIGGSSSGAICAFTVAWHRPDQFRNVVSMIGSFTDIHGGHVYPDRVLETAAKPIRIFLQDGIDDNRSPENPDRDWYLQNQKMKAALERKGYDMAFVLGEGGHADDHGGAILPQMLRWVWRDFPGVVPPQGDLVAAAAAIRPTIEDPLPDFDATAKVDPRGDWTWERRGGGGVTKSVLSLKSEGNALTGIVSTRRGEGEPTAAPVTKINLEGNRLTVQTTLMIRDRELPVTMQGIVDGDKIAGWSMTSAAGHQRDTRWQAARATAQ